LKYFSPIQPGLNLFLFKRLEGEEEEVQVRMKYGPYDSTGAVSFVSCHEKTS
jgi:hypothetical protein